MTQSNVFRRLLLGSACVIALAIPAHAQYNASIQGTVTDTSGAAIPDAHVTITDTETNRTLDATTNSSGTFNLNQLPPSTYKVNVTHEGFNPKQLDNVGILPEQANALNIQLEAGGATQTVTVNAAERPLIDTQTGQITGTIDQQQISHLPSYGRDVFQLVQLTPGVFGDASQASGGGTNTLPGNQGPGGSGGATGIFVTENRPQASANGGRTDQNNITLDGASINSVTWQGAAIVTPSEDSIKEVKVTANSYDATFGRAGSAQIQALSQNGTNNFHGTAFFKANRPGLNAFQRYDPNNNPQRNNSRFNQIGGTVGGPIWRNHLFFFFSYETIRNNAKTIGGGWYDTASFDSAAPSGTIASQFVTVKGAGAVYSKVLEGAGDHHTCTDIGLTQGVNCNFIEGQGLDLGRPLIGFPRGTPDPSYVSNTQPGLGGDGTGSPANLDGIPDLFYVSTIAPNTQTAQQFNGRIDFQVTSKDLVAFNIYNVPLDSTTYQGPARGYNLFHHNQINYAETLLWNHIFSPTWLNEVRVNAAGWKWNEITSNPQSPLGLPIAKIQTATANEALGTLLSTNDATGLQQFGPLAGSVFDQATYTLRDQLTKVAGNHNIRFGGEGTKEDYLDESPGNAQPTYSFLNLWDFLNDAPIGENATADPRTGIPSFFRKDLRSDLFAAFIQDDWRLKPNLTVNLGLRWEYFGSLAEKKGNLSNLRLGGGPNVLSGIRFQVGGNEVTPPKYNFGPQIGFAWSPMNFNGKMVLRGGFGIGYNGPELAITTTTRFNPPFLASNQTLSGNQVVYALGSSLYTLGTLPPNPALRTAFDANNLPLTPGVSLNVTGLPTDLPTAYTYRYSLESQYDIGRQWVGTIGYQGSLGRHLPLQTNLNAAYAPAVLAGQASFNPKLNYINWFYDQGSSNFNALLLELQHQFAHSFQLDAQYRWSKSLDNGSGPYVLPDYIFLPGFNYGSSDFDVRNYFKLWGLWSPVIFHGNHNWIEKIAGGWTFSGIGNVHSGFPFNPAYNGIGSNAVIPDSGQGNLRPGAYLGGAGTSQSTDTFKQNNGNFPRSGPSGADGVYFLKPAVFTNATAWPSDGTAPAPAPLPQLPGIGRNAFYGPRYFDVDATVTKAFGFPTLPVLGEQARLEIRANAYNLFNKLNLFSPQTNVLDAHFGRARQVLGARTVELEAHFRF
jgi:hypothetical protein